MLGPRFAIDHPSSETFIEVPLDHNDFTNGNINNNGSIKLSNILTQFSSNKPEGTLHLLVDGIVHSYIHICNGEIAVIENAMSNSNLKQEEGGADGLPAWQQFADYGLSSLKPPQIGSGKTDVILVDDHQKGKTAAIVAATFVRGGLTVSPGSTVTRHDGTIVDDAETIRLRDPFNYFSGTTLTSLCRVRSPIDKKAEGDQGLECTWDEIKKRNNGLSTREERLVKHWLELLEPETIDGTAMDFDGNTAYPASMRKAEMKHLESDAKRMNPAYRDGKRLQNDLPGPMRKKPNRKKLKVKRKASRR